MDETKLCNVLESLKKNYVVKEYAIGHIVERTEGLRTVQSILDIYRWKVFEDGMLEESWGETGDNTES